MASDNEIRPQGEGRPEPINPNTGRRFGDSTKAYSDWQEQQSNEAEIVGARREAYKELHGTSSIENSELESAKELIRNGHGDSLTPKERQRAYDQLALEEAEKILENAAAKRIADMPSEELEDVVTAVKRLEAATSTIGEKEPEKVAFLNELARRDIYGSGETEYIDPATGEKLPSVNGELNDIRADAKIGDDVARERAVKAYEDSLQLLMEEGLELCQAKLMMDLRAEHEKKFADMELKLRREYEEHGDSLKEAREKSQARVNDLKSKWDLRTRLKILNEEILTREDYEKSADKNDKDDEGKENTDEVDKTDKEDDGENEEKDKDKLAPPKFPEFGPDEEHLQALRESGDKWAKLLARRRRVAVAITAPKKQEVEQASQDWESKILDAGNSIREQYNEAKTGYLDEYRIFLESLIKEDLSPEDLAVAQADIDAKLKKVGEQYDIEVENTISKYIELTKLTEASRVAEQTAQEAVDLYESKGPKYKIILEWWAKQGGGKFFSKHRIVGNLKKGLVLVVPGFIIGAATLPIAAGLGVAAGAAGLTAAMASGIGRGLIASKLGKEASDPTVADKMAESIKAEIKAESEKGEEGEDVKEIINSQAESSVNRNRRRFVIAGLIGAGSALAGRWLSQNVVDWLNPTPPVGQPTGLGGGAGTGAPLPKIPTGNIEDFYVQKGSGMIQELQETFAREGYGNLDDQEAFGLYQHLFHRFGPKHIVNLEKIPGLNQDVYQRGGIDYGISEPGRAHWTQNVADYLAKNHGKWA